MPTKDFKTYEEQLTILEKRGLIVPDRTAALHHLCEKNYYRLSAYSLTMRTRDPVTNEERFYRGSTFDQLIELYDFDTDFRACILAATATVETNLKSYLAYYHGGHYGPTGYLNNANFEDPWRHAQLLNAISRSLAQRKDEQFVRHHVKDLSGVFPVWAIVEVCSFDQISLMFKNLKPMDRDAMARQFYHISSREYIENWVHCAVVARNIAAHGARFYNRPRINPPARLPKSVSASGAKPFGCIYAICHLLPPSARPPFLADIQTAFSRHPFALPRHLGLPDDWVQQILNGEGLVDSKQQDALKDCLGAV